MNGSFFFIVILAVAVLTIASMWMLFEKAGKAGWKSIIPIYNSVVLLEIVGITGWAVLLFLIPLVNFVFAIVVYVKLSEVFGKGAGFAVGLLFLPMIFFPILGFGSAEYQGSAAA